MSIIRFPVCRAELIFSSHCLLFIRETATPSTVTISSSAHSWQSSAGLPVVRGTDRRWKTRSVLVTSGQRRWGPSGVSLIFEELYFKVQSLWSWFLQTPWRINHRAFNQPFTCSGHPRGTLWLGGSGVCVIRSRTLLDLIFLHNPRLPLLYCIMEVVSTCTSQLRGKH